MIYDIFYASKGTISDRDFEEFRSRFPTAQKIQFIESFEEIRKKSFTKFFWVVWDDLIVEENFNFDYRVSKWDEKYVHVFKNGNFYDGITLFSKDILISKKEFDHRFYTNKKEIDIVVSNPKPFDIVFISYNEINADENYKNLLDRFPRAKRVHGIKGIHHAHIEAAKISDTDRFWVVDGDAEILDTFDFTTDQIAHYDPYNRQSVSVWFSQNPINDLVYGYGGVKLLPKTKTLKMDIESVDMTTSISDNFKIIPAVSNYTNFNTDPFNTWKSAFRECVKLASQAIDKNYQEETEERLKIWCTIGKEKPFGEYAIAGANAGKEYGLLHIGNKVALSMINDFDWLNKKFEKNNNRLSDG
jgi:hypothetical protein